MRESGLSGPPAEAVADNGPICSGDAIEAWSAPRLALVSTLPPAIIIG